MKLLLLPHSKETKRSKLLTLTRQELQDPPSNTLPLLTSTKLNVPKQKQIPREEYLANHLLTYQDVQDKENLFRAFQKREKKLKLLTLNSIPVIRDVPIPNPSKTRLTLRLEKESRRSNARFEDAEEIVSVKSASPVSHSNVESFDSVDSVPLPSVSEPIPIVSKQTNSRDPFVIAITPPTFHCVYEPHQETSRTLQDGSNWVILPPELEQMYNYWVEEHASSFGTTMNEWIQSERRINDSLGRIETTSWIHEFNRRRIRYRQNIALLANSMMDDQESFSR